MEKWFEETFYKRRHSNDQELLEKVLIRKIQTKNTLSLLLHTHKITKWWQKGGGTEIFIAGVGTDTLGNSLTISYEFEYVLTIWPTISIPKYLTKTKENTSSRKVLHWTITAALLVRSLKWNHQCPSNCNVMEMWHIYAMNYYLAIKTNKLLIWDAWSI